MKIQEVPEYFTKTGDRKFYVKEKGKIYTCYVSKYPSKNLLVLGEGNDPYAKIVTDQDLSARIHLECCKVIK